MEKPLEKQLYVADLSLGLRIKQLLRGVVAVAHRILPEKAYQSIYSFLFPRYKAFLRTWYRVSGELAALITKDNVLLMKVRRISSVMPYTLVGRGGLEASYDVASELNKKKISGDFVELGVARGGCAALLGMLAFDGSVRRSLWLFDSFEGLPDPTAEDFVDGETGVHLHPLQKGSCLGTLPQVQSLLLGEFKLPSDKVKFIKGWFQDSLPINKSSLQEIALLRIDGDWYESTKCCLEHLYDRVVPGGVIVIDDYQSCFGCRRAVDEFRIARGISSPCKLDGRGGCYFWKVDEAQSAAASSAA